MTIGNNHPIIKVDLHVHTSERSACAVTSSEEQIRAAIAAGLDAIIITDHHRFVPPEELERLNKLFAPFQIFGGIEVTCQEEEDFIVLGLRESVLETPGMAYAALHALVRKGSGYFALAHPFRRHPVQVNLKQCQPDAIEVHSPNTPPSQESCIRAIAVEQGMQVLSNSDAHSPHNLGRYYNRLSSPVYDETGLLDALRAGRHTSVMEVDRK